MEHAAALMNETVKVAGVVAEEGVTLKKAGCVLTMLVTVNGIPLPSDEFTLTFTLGVVPVNWTGFGFTLSDCANTGAATSMRIAKNRENLRVIRKDASIFSSANTMI